MYMPTNPEGLGETAQEAVYHLTQQDVDSVLTMASGLVSVGVFSLLVQLLTLGVLLVIVFTIALRRF